MLDGCLEQTLEGHLAQDAMEEDLEDGTTEERLEDGTMEERLEDGAMGGDPQYHAMEDLEDCTMK